jgi:hypothetical protein
MTSDTDPNEDLISSITPEVMQCLTTNRFFEALDDVLSPAEESRAPLPCRGDYENTRFILRRLGFDDAELDDIFGVLRNQGGFCDCEILYNVVESSRLKAKYWRAKADGRCPSTTHHGGNNG